MGVKKTFWKLEKCGTQSNMSTLEVISSIMQPINSYLNQIKWSKDVVHIDLSHFDSARTWWF